MRCRSEGLSEYVPYPTIETVKVGRALLERPTLMLETAAGWVASDLPGNVDLDAIYPTIFSRRDAARETQAAMARERGELAGWVASVSASKSLQAAGGMYRSSMIDESLFERTLADPNDAIEARAASAHFLLARGRVELVSRYIREESPPLLIATTRLSSGGEAIVSDALLDDVLPFLSLRDRVVFGQRTRSVPVG